MYDINEPINWLYQLIVWLLDPTNPTNPTLPTPTHLAYWEGLRLLKPLKPPENTELRTDPYLSFNIEFSFHL